MYTIENLTPCKLNDWESVIQHCPDSNAFHSTIWRDALKNSFKQLTPKYLLIKQNESIIGGIPAFVFEPIPGIRLWYSMPWNLIGGFKIHERYNIDPMSLISSIETFLQTESSERGWCELSWTLSPADTVKHGDLLETRRYKSAERFTHILKTNNDINSLWNAYNKRVRGAVRKSQKSGVEVVDTDSDEHLSEFYKMYLITIKRLGGTPKPRALMKFLLQNRIAKLAIATYRDTIVAGLLYLYYNRTVTLWCEASIPEYLQFRPNNAIFHHIITWACQEGYEYVDFGASPPESKGLIAHKEQYNAHKTDFCSYTKIVSPFKRSLWTHSENTLRKIYTWLQ